MTSFWRLEPKFEGWNPNLKVGTQIAMARFRVSSEYTSSPFLTHHWTKYWVITDSSMLVFGAVQIKQGSLYQQPKQYSIVREIPQNYYKCVLFDPPKVGFI